MLQEQVLLAPLTTFGVGGSARFFVEAKSIAEVREALDFARTRAVPVFVLGGGSNIVIADEGFPGLVLLMRIADITFETQDTRVLITVGAGFTWDDFVSQTIERQLTGLECLSGVPGTVGGAVVANLGAYGAQVSDTFVQAEVIDTSDVGGGITIIKKEQCDFSYHDSMFSRERQCVIVRATFALATDPGTIPTYRDNRFNMAALAERLGRTPTGGEVREEVLRMREEKGSLIMPGRVSYRCAGSFFHMPFVGGAQYEKVVARAHALDAQMEERLRPLAWKQTDGSYKVAPGFLLEYTEFRKGYVRGGVGISPRHTLSIIAVADARAADIAKLARDMQDAVEKLFGIQLEREVEYVGAVETENNV